MDGFTQRYECTVFDVGNMHVFLVVVISLLLLQGACVYESESSAVRNAHVPKCVHTTVSVCNGMTGLQSFTPQQRVSSVGVFLST